MRSPSIRATVSVPSHGRGPSSAATAASRIVCAAGRSPASVTSRASSSRTVTGASGSVTEMGPPRLAITVASSLAVSGSAGLKLSDRRSHEPCVDDLRDLRRREVRVAGGRAGATPVATSVASTTKATAVRCMDVVSAPPRPSQSFRRRELGRGKCAAGATVAACGRSPSRCSPFSRWRRSPAAEARPTRPSLHPRRSRSRHRRRRPESSTALSGVTLDGDAITLGDLRGRPVLINVWSSW